MLESFFKFPVSHTIVSKEGLRGITPSNIGTAHSSFLEFQYEHARMRVYFESDDQLFEYYHSLEKELGVKTIEKC